ncbi:hypothetical protein KZJ38_01085 [Paraburkholderia edwinii]|uniref:Uncharacterized protein n=1 Tax=Paraburkholderia edwinii TaxID=2861782 RepID=A0ABX8UPY6_9BURK|nr:hypothetical protein [Paraburkholderia edwinii]QYD69025.1 hypothetical protein KZJ38_01085 [Paraburkholderia edwinii]
MSKQLPNLIYIVKPEEVPQSSNAAETYPNFTIPGVTPTVDTQPHIRPAPSDIALSSTAALAARAALTTVAPVGLPVSLLVAVATYSPAIMQLFTKNKEELPKEIESQLEKVGDEDVQAFMREHAYSLQMTEQDDLMFPPGHPQIGKVYQRHPLAKVKSANKERVFIPAEQYDKLLLEEREAELLRLLVHLGATSISIAKRRRVTKSSKFEVNVSGSAPIASADIAATQASKTAMDDADTRVFELVGKGWRSGETLDRSLFAWAAFEPSWDALIVAREIGGCTQAELEVRETSIFSSDRNLTSAVAAKLYKANAGGGIASEKEEESVYIVKTQFAAPLSAKNV